MRNTFSICLLFAACLSATSIHAGSTYDFEPYSVGLLEQLQAEGAPVLVEVRTDWCTTCEAQRKALSEVLDHSRLNAMKVLRLDWDEQKAEAEALGASRQSTLILFVGEEEIDRSIGETDSDRLLAFVAQAFACE